MSASEVREIVRRRTIDTLLGDGFRADDPRTIGGLFRTMLSAIKRGDDPRVIAGVIEGHLTAVDFIDNAVAELNEQ